MYSNDDLASLYMFLKNTPEGNLRKMMVSGKMTDAHFRLLVKVAKGCSEADFINHAQNASLPKLKFSAAEIAIRENFWMVCFEVIVSLGLITPAAKAA